MIEECDDGDFDFFDIVTDWGERCIKEGITRSRDEYFYQHPNLKMIVYPRFLETMNEMNDKKET